MKTEYIFERVDGKNGSFTYIFKGKHTQFAIQEPLSIRKGVSIMIAHNQGPHDTSGKPIITWTCLDVDKEDVENIIRTLYYVRNRMVDVDV